MFKPSLVKWAKWAKVALAALCLCDFGSAQAQTPSASAEAQPAKRKNLVLIMVDDLSPRELGCYGGLPETPAIDRLGEQGTRFLTAYASPLCTPSRFMVMTGQYGFRTGVLGNDKQFKPPPRSPRGLISSHRTFADCLGDAGYVCGVTGKWRLGGSAPELIYDAGFHEYRIWGSRESLPPAVVRWWYRTQALTPRYWHPALLQDGAFLPTEPEDYGPDLYTDWAIDFMSRHRSEPFFLYYPMCLVHRPHFDTPDPSADLASSTSNAKARWPVGMRSYVRYTDHCVGRIVEALDRLKLSEDTVVIFCSDNGNQDSGKGEANERGAQVPFIVRCPGTVAEGVVSPELTDLTDVLPTLVDFAGSELPDDYVGDGTSLMPTLLDPEVPHRDWIFSYLNEHRVLRDKRWLWESQTGLYDCGESRDGSGYQFVADAEGGLMDKSSSSEVMAAQARFEAILQKLPAPQSRSTVPDQERWEHNWSRKLGKPSTSDSPQK